MADAASAVSFADVPFDGGLKDFCARMWANQGRGGDTRSVLIYIMLHVAFVLLEMAVGWRVNSIGMSLFSNSLCVWV